MAPASENLTVLLAAAGRGEEGAWDRLLPYVYDELRQLAMSQMQGERAGHTIQPTALVHEAFIRLADQQTPNWRNRAYFFGAAAQVMRRVLVDFARHRKAAKRGGGGEKQPLEDTLVDFEERSADLLTLDDALRRLAEFAPEQARIVELRFFGGLSVDETAQLMGVSSATIDRGWRIAKAWLLRECSRD